MTTTQPEVPDTMTAITLVGAGRPPELASVNRPTPSPGPGEALLRVDACGFCHHDLLVMGGVLRRGVVEGVTLGHEIAGTVIAVTPEVSGVQVGDRVVSLLTAACGQCVRCRQGREHRCLVGEGIGHGRDGGFAEYVALPASSLVAVPDGIGAEQAALLACPVGVALNGVEAAGVAEGDTVVVTGAGGGLGVHAVQIAASRGAQVIAATTSADKVAGLESLGASVVIDANDIPDYAEVVAALTEDVGADAVIDTVGGPAWPASVRCLGQYGRLALLGDVTGEPVSLRVAEVIFRDAHMVGVSGVSLDTLERAVSLVADGAIRPLVAETLPLTPEGVAEAFRLVSERRPLGRVALRP